MSRRLVALAFVAAALASPSVAAAAAPQLQVVGNHLVDGATGQTFIPRGANWPSFEYACFYGYAYSNTAQDGNVDPSAQGAAVIASWHINTVRIPLNQNCWLGLDGSPAFGTVNGYRAAVQSWVNTLNAAGIAVILDLHWSSPAGVPAEGQRAMPDDRSDDFWSSVATTFKDNRSVMFDVFNEPYSRTPDFDLTWACWTNGGCQVPTANDGQPISGTTYTALGMATIVAAIRATGARQPILLGGRDYANDLGSWLASRPNDDQLVASFHNYNDQVCHTTACWNATIAPVAAQVPVVTGEFGSNDCTETPLNTYMAWADQHGVGYLGWAWWVLTEDPTCKGLALLSNVDGTPRAPNGTALKAHLAAVGAPAAAGTTTSASTTPAGAGTSTPKPGVTHGSAGTGPKIVLSGSTRQRLGRSIAVRVRCGERCRVSARGKLTAGRAYALRKASVRLERNQSWTLALGIPAKARHAALLALKRHRKATARITLTVTGVTGNRTTAARTVRLRR